MWKMHEESRSYLFFKCNFTTEVWQTILYINGQRYKCDSWDLESYVQAKVWKWKVAKSLVAEPLF